MGRDRRTCLQKEPARRPQSVTEIADRLNLRSRRTRRQTARTLENCLPDSVARLRRRVKQWAVGVAPLLIIIVALVIWQMLGQSEMKAEMAKLQAGRHGISADGSTGRGSQTEKDQAASAGADLRRNLGSNFRSIRKFCAKNCRSSLTN